MILAKDSARNPPSLRETTLRQKKSSVSGFQKTGVPKKDSRAAESKAVGGRP